jgi:hypothetical protein
MFSPGDLPTRLGPGLTLLIALAAAGCGGDRSGTGEWTGTVEDSLGIRIVTSPPQGIWTEDTRWRVEEELSIGVEGGDPELEFGQLGGVDVDDQGRILALDMQAARVRIFDNEGELVHAFGRPGSGPGELSNTTMGVFVTDGGEILVPDMANGRLSRFTAEGEALSAVPLDLAHGFPMAWSRTSDGGLVHQVRRMDLAGGGGTPADAMDAIVRLDLDGEAADTLAVIPAGLTFSSGGAGGAPQIRIFAPEPVWTVLDGPRVVTGLNSEYSLHVRDTSGEVASIFRRDFTRRPVTPAHQNAFRDGLGSAWEDAGLPPQAIGQLLENVEFAEEWPALAALLPGPDGTLWVQRVEREVEIDPEALADLQAFQPGSSNWDVFDGEGRYLGIVEMPDGFMPWRIMDEAMVGIHRDELGIQRVMRLRLIRPEPEAG